MCIGTVARLCELYDRQNDLHHNNQDEVGSDIVKDRRFQLLVECVLCGVDVTKRTREAEQMSDSEVEEEARDIEAVLDEENVQMDEGLSVRDSKGWLMGPKNPLKNPPRDPQESPTIP